MLFADILAYGKQKLHYCWGGGWGGSRKIICQNIWFIIKDYSEFKEILSSSTTYNATENRRLQIRNHLVEFLYTLLDCIKQKKMFLISYNYPTINNSIFITNPSMSVGACKHKHVSIINLLSTKHVKEHLDHNALTSAYCQYEIRTKYWQMVRSKNALELTYINTFQIIKTY